MTVFETRGSTYSKPGERMLIDTNGVFQGMLSGGCLEGDLAIRAAVVIESGKPLAVSYDLAQDDELWGLGVGCDGLIRVFMQPISSATDYEPLASIADILGGDSPGMATTVIESSHDGIEPGATSISAAATCSSFDVSDEYAEAISSAGDAQEDASRLVEIVVQGSTLKVLCAALVPPPGLLVLGAGLDAEPVVRFAAELGWRATVVDHRQAYVDSGDFSAAKEVICMPADRLEESLDLSRFDRAIVMSHHLVSDRTYLRQLANTEMTYIGLLGPADRRERLLTELGEAAAALDGRVHGPAGLDIGGRGPAAIALSIVAEMQQRFA